MKDNQEVKEDLKKMIKDQSFSEQAVKDALERITLLEGDIKTLNQILLRND